MGRSLHAPHTAHFAHSSALPVSANQLPKRLTVQQIFGCFLLAILIDVAAGILLGKLLSWSARGTRPVDEPAQQDDSEPYPRWYE
ncbi:hypothetical protein [Paraburkholderia sp. SIMBA_027]|uniref:hypothetical protein n=1 Tax=Paraburkholderia sp. SIMBA_027 TaxID=3085770 RepID=UPI00397B9664